MKPNTLIVSDFNYINHPKVTSVFAPWELTEFVVYWLDSAELDP
jgi:hypothetical protein